MVGTNQWNSGGKRYKIEKVIVHENYGNDDRILHAGDIALIRLTKPIDFNQRVQPIKCATKEVPNGSVCQAFGWGRLKLGGARPDYLQTLKVKAISKEECQLKSNQYIDDSYLCTIAPAGKGTCNVSEKFSQFKIFRKKIKNYMKTQGDSGGPLVHNFGSGNELVGLVSFSKP